MTQFITPDIGSYTSINGDKNSCSVLALVNAFDISFEEAQKLTFMYNRKKDCGMFIEDFNRLLWKEFNCHMSQILGCTRIAKNYLKRKGREYQKGYTVKRFIETHPKGTYLLYVLGHFTVVRDGKLRDFSNHVKANGSVILVWEKNNVDAV